MHTTPTTYDVMDVVGVSIKTTTPFHLTSDSSVQCYSLSTAKKNCDETMFQGLVWVSCWLTFCKWSNGLIPH